MEKERRKMNHVLESSMMGRAGDRADHGREQGCQVLQPVSCSQRSWDFRGEQSPPGQQGRGVGLPCL